MVRVDDEKYVDFVLFEFVYVFFLDCFKKLGGFN